MRHSKTRAFPVSVLRAACLSGKQAGFSPRGFSPLDALRRAVNPVYENGKRHRSAYRLLLGVLPFMPLCSVLAQEPGQADTKPAVRSGNTPAEVHPLASKEEMIRDRFQRFEDRVFRLREQLSDAEPDSAARLGRVLLRAGELGLSDRLEQMIELLRDPSSLTEATDFQSQWLADADRLLAILLERDSDNEERQRRIDRWQDYRKKIAAILEQQRALREATGSEAVAGRINEQIDQAIQRIDALLKRQASVSEATQRMAEGASEEGVGPAASTLGDRQQSLSHDTAQLAEDLKRLAAAQSERAADDAADQTAAGETQAAAESVQRGANAMERAGQSIRQADPSSAGSEQRRAAEALKEARKRLQEAKRKLGENADSQELAEKQEEIAGETGDLSAQMQQDASAEGGAQGQPGGQQGSPTPGRQNLDQARREMDDASQSLRQTSPRDAAPSQDRAIEQLRQAQKELEKALNQLRKEQREETLRDLEARFRDMLSKQRAINEATVRLDRTGRERFRRAELLELADLSTRERALSQDAATCLHILDEDGTTVAFPRVVEQLSEDMATVAERLAAYFTGTLTQTIEREIVETLEQLLGAIQRMQQENEQQGIGGGQMASGPSPLLPPSAELKLLRASQVRINERTAVIASARAEQADPAEALAGALEKVARRQAQCARIAQEMRDRRNQP